MKPSSCMAFSKVEEEGQEYKIYDEFFACEDEFDNSSHTTELTNH
jgi:hypothetical protein